MAARSDQTYSILQPGNFAIIQERDRAVHAALRRHGITSLEHLRVFEAGCGGGYNLRMFQQWGCPPANLAGIDIDAERTAFARENSPGIQVHTGSADSVSEPDASFDIAVAFTLFSSVPDDGVSAGIAREMLRLTKPGGLLLVYDMRRKSPRNPAVHPIKDADVRRWFRPCRPRTQRLTLVPPLARAVAGKAPWLYRPLSLPPLSRTHTLHVMQRPATTTIASDRAVDSKDR
jgi:SAM-dependent methyltransferase